MESSAADQASNPGVKLLDTYKRLSESAKSGQRQSLFETKRAQGASDAVSEMKAIDGELMKKWCEQWGFY